MPTLQTSALALPIKDRRRLMKEYVIVSVFAPFLAGILPFYSFADLMVLMAVTVWAAYVVVSRIRSGMWTLQVLGLRLDNFWKAAPWYCTATALCIAVLAIWGNVIELRKDFNTENYVLYSAVGSPLQEFLYRSYLMVLGSMLFTRNQNLFLNVCLFTLMHWFFPDPWIVIPATAVVGAMFALLYWYFPNLLLASVSHAAINFAAINVYLF